MITILGKLKLSAELSSGLRAKPSAWYPRKSMQRRRRNCGWVPLEQAAAGDAGRQSNLSVELRP